MSTRRHPSTEASMKYNPPIPITLCNKGPNLGLQSKKFNHFKTTEIFIKFLPTSCFLYAAGNSEKSVKTGLYFTYLTIPNPSDTITINILAKALLELDTNSANTKAPRTVNTKGERCKLQQTVNSEGLFCIRK